MEAKLNSLPLNETTSALPWFSFHLLQDEADTWNNYFRLADTEVPSYTYNFTLVSFICPHQYIS